MKYRGGSKRVSVAMLDRGTIMKLLVGTLAACAVMMATTTGSHARCAAGIFMDNDYCVSCARKTFKVNYCPGGEAGRVTVGQQYRNCTVSFYDRTTCRAHGPMRVPKRHG
jgi:hypothetical protein